MLAVARERHPRQSVGHIGLLSSPHPPGGGGEGLGERGGMNKALKLLQSVSARPLNDFYNASPCWTCASSYQRCSNSCAATPTLTPTLSRPAGRERELNSPIWPRVKGGEFNVGGQRSKQRSTAVLGLVFEVMTFTVESQFSKRFRPPARLNVALCA